MYKNNSRDNRKFKSRNLLQYSFHLIGMEPEFGYYSYTQRCASCTYLGLEQNYDRKNYTTNSTF